MIAEAIPQTLDRLQNWFHAAIAHPDGVREGVASWDARQHLDVAVEEAESVLTRSNSQPAIDRLAVYGHAYFARLVDCLREEYPVLKSALGDEIFDAFATEYLQRFPSRSYTLFELGTKFPQFLRDARPADVGTDPAWPDFLIDLATLELAFNEVFDGPGTEGKPILDEAAIAAVAPERLPEARLIAAPCLRVLAFKYPVHTYFTAVRRSEDSPLPEPAETFLAVTRSEYIVRHFEMSKPAYLLLSALLRGETLGTAIGEVVTGERSEMLELQLGEWFRDWASQGFFLSLVDGSDVAEGVH